MTWKSFALRLFVGLAFAFWTVNVLAVAVFAVSDRYTGIQSVFMTLVVLVGGFAPVAVLFYLFRDHLTPEARTWQASKVRVLDVVLPGRTKASELEAPVEALSERELEVLALIGRGFSNKEIAGHLSVAVGTVKTHMNNINRKLGSRTRTQAVARARDHGFL